MMWNVIRRPFLVGLPAALALCLSVPQLHAQAQVETVLQHQLHRVDFAISGVGIFTGSTSGTNFANSTPRPAEAQALTQRPSNTLGALVTLRYTKAPLLGAEFNYSYARYNESYSAILSGVQANVSEITLGYVAHGPELLGLGIKPFGAIGAGVTTFTPTTFGGQGLREQARATYYYAVGAEAPVLYEGRVGLRAQVRQAFFLAPDFGQNYLTIKQRTSSFEPAVGIYLHF